MKTSLQATLLTLVVFAASAHAEEPNLPRPELKLKEKWATLQKKGFNHWRIDQFVGWSGVADGGSMAFEFLRGRGIEFDVLVANPAYWTDADKKAKRQVTLLDRIGAILPACSSIQTGEAPFANPDRHGEHSEGQ